MGDFGKGNALLILELFPDLITDGVLILVMVLHLTARPIGENPDSERLIFLKVVINLESKVVLSVSE